MGILEYFDHPEKKQNKEHFINLVQVAMADGVIDKTEMDLLYLQGRKMSFTDIEIDGLIETSRIQAYYPVHEFQKRFEHVYDIICMVLADGIMDETEMRLVNIYASRLGFSESEIPSLLEHIINGVRQNKSEEDLFEEYRKQRKYLRIQHKT